jgi:hypothetical protein
MDRRNSKLKQEIQERRSSSGLGVGCAEAQADGVPCPDPARDCDHCERAAAATTGPVRATRRRAKR